MVTIVADKHIPFLHGALEPYARVVYLAGDRIGRADLEHADGLITRTRTVCDEAMLRGSPVRFIATATIGFDHIDADYCEAHGIRWHHAPGCNSSSVTQYIGSALAHLAISANHKIPGKTIGIIGVGNVGKKAANLAIRLGLKVLLNDPPRERAEGQAGFTSMEEIAETADIISLHVPLNPDGIDKTVQLADETFFSRLRRSPVLINTSRGPVVETSAVKSAVKHGWVSAYIADVWENEPDIDSGLLALAEIGTPHIAGYSVEGKANGTAACVRAASRFFGFGMDDWYPEQLPTPANPIIHLVSAGKSNERLMYEAILKSYNILEDDRRLRRDPASFESLRNHYPVRREFGAFTVKLDESRPEPILKLKSLGFKIPHD
jgi:erythronate-4-phosphate dehydrogenase